MSTLYLSLSLPCSGSTLYLSSLSTKLTSKSAAEAGLSALPSLVKAEGGDVSLASFESPRSYEEDDPNQLCILPSMLGLGPMARPLEAKLDTNGLVLPLVSVDFATDSSSAGVDSSCTFSGAGVGAAVAGGGATEWLSAESVVLGVSARLPFPSFVSDIFGRDDCTLGLLSPAAGLSFRFVSVSIGP